MPLVLAMTDTDEKDFAALLVDRLAEQGVTDIEQVLAYEISCYDCQPPALVGMADDFIASARLDNLLSCYVGMQALIASDGDVSSLLVCTDHEEVGSQSAAGAGWSRSCQICCCRISPDEPGTDYRSLNDDLGR